MRTIMTIIVAAAFAAMAGGCKSECAAFGSKLCSMACACTEGKECAFTSGDGSFTVTFDEKSSCRFFYVNFGCPPPDDSDFDYAGCSEALDDAVCVDTDEGGALQVPDDPACEENF